MTDLSSIIARLSSGDTGRPVVTCYDRLPGPTEGERIEISARVMLTWAAKAAGALTDELMVEPGSRVGLALPAHWRLGYWALATWWAGATLVTGDGALDADVLVTDDPSSARAHHGDGVLVTLAALSRRAAGDVPPGFLDEAAELAGFPDRFSRPGVTSPTTIAWERTGGVYRYDAPVTVSESRTAVVAGPGGAEPVLERMVQAWCGAGSVVVVRSPDTPSDLTQLLASEHTASVEYAW